jgi:hypothetical protein
MDVMEPHLPHIFYHPGRLALRLVNLFLGFVELALGIRFILELTGANPAAGFVVWIYQLTESWVHPFVGMFPPLNLHILVLDPSTLLAMFAYACLGWLIIYVFAILSD